jgi:hypothetical protein
MTHETQKKPLRFSVKSNTNPKCITHFFHPNCASNYVFRRVRPRRIFFFVLEGPVITLEIIIGLNQAILQNPRLGWVISGSVPTGATTKSCCCEVTRPSEDQVAKFLESQAVSNKQIQRSKKFYANGVPDGRFIVRRPMKFGNSEQLGFSKEMAIKRFKPLENKFQCTCKCT